MTYLEILIVVLLFFPYVGFLRWVCSVLSGGSYP